ncbi:MAG: type IV secretion system protein, partial [Nitrososphaerota archaeon]|nr:type IV secretion system protein [Nitrososphaerota archaeon]
LWSTVRIIANLALVLVVLGGGYGLIVSEHTNTPYHEAMELLPRLILGALLVNTSLSWAQVAIDLNNALCQAIGGAKLPAWDQASTSTQALADLVAAIVYLSASLLLVLQMLTRLALIDVLLVVSPIALLCWVLPQTQSWARLWSSTFFATVLTQFVQVLALRLGSALLADSAVIGSNAVLLRLLLGVAVIVLTLKLPGLMRAHLDSGLGFARYYAYRVGAQAISGGASKVGAVVAGARGRGGA